MKTTHTVTGRGRLTRCFIPAPAKKLEDFGGRFHDIPGDAALRMDKTPGVEKVYVVLSDHPLEIRRCLPEDG